MNQFYEMQSMKNKINELNTRLQHPRRSLGNRHKSQALKFLNLGKQEPNITWAEQNAKQAILYDFTNPDNWRILIQIKVINKDALGIRLVLEDLFTVLGRDSELLNQLEIVDLVNNGQELLEAAFKIDPLDSEIWWNIVKDNDVQIDKFSSRLKRLDTRDSRANILFSKRIKKLWESGYEELFIELSKYLLAQNPGNYEVWIQIGKLHERRCEYDLAWHSYDQAQIYFPKCNSRDDFKLRMQRKMDEKSDISWKKPRVEDRVLFLKKMEELTYDNADKNTKYKKSEPIIIDIYSKLEIMINSDEKSKAFFIARQMAAEGDKRAELIVKEIIKEM